MNPKTPNGLACALHGFFADYLPRLRGLSPHTILSYRDSLLLLLRYLAAQIECPVAHLSFEAIEPLRVLAFLNHLEQERGNGIPTRNVRLSAIHSFFRYVAAHHPERLEQAQRILGIPFKRTRTREVEYLEYEEIQALLDAVDCTTRRGRRDYALIATLFNTGARVQEILDLRARDLVLTKPFQVRLFGKGRKERFCPLWPQTAQVLRTFCRENHVDLRSDAPVFTNHRGEPLTRFGVRYILAKQIALAQSKAPGLSRKRLHPHSLRHSTAVHLLKAGVDLSTIGQWLGHASVNTTNKYAAIDLEMKRRALARARPAGKRQAARWRKDESILAWLEAL
jgi:integrase/recombinase XerD